MCLGTNKVLLDFTRTSATHSPSVLALFMHMIFSNSSRSRFLFPAPASTPWWVTPWPSCTRWFWALDRSWKQSQKPWARARSAGVRPVAFRRLQRAHKEDGTLVATGATTDDKDHRTLGN